MVTGPGRKRNGRTGKFAIVSSTDGGGGVAGGGDVGRGGLICGGDNGEGSGAPKEGGRTVEKEGWEITERIRGPCRLIISEGGMAVTVISLST
jgi:hypothetical protein